MGLDLNSSKLLIWSKSAGVDFSNTAMLGRHCFMGVSNADLQKQLFDAGESQSPELISTGYIEPLLQHLGARSVDSFDASAYENASQIWDMNTPIPERFHDRYSVVFDGGTLEHVFNFPNAILSAMKMVKPGGHLITCVPADGMFGHGLYQFSADLFFSLFSPPNGYEVVKLIVFQDYRDAPFYEVISPSLLKRRNALCSNMPTLIYVIGRRIEDVPERLVVMQSDYEAAWNDSENSRATKNARKPWGSVFLRRYAKGVIAALWNIPFSSRAGFARWSPEKKR